MTKIFKLLIKGEQNHFDDSIFIETSISNEKIFTYIQEKNILLVKFVIKKLLKKRI